MLMLELALREPLDPKASVPALTAVPPENVFALVSVSVPVPALVNAPVLVIMPPSVSVWDAPTPTVAAEFKLTLLVSVLLTTSSL